MHGDPRATSSGCWRRPLIDEAASYLARARALDPDAPPPWTEVLALYDALLRRQDDPVVRLNRAVAVAETHGVTAALAELELLDRDLL